MTNLLNIADASKFLSISKSALYKMCEKREIPHYKIGARISFAQDDLLSWLKLRRVETETELELEASRYIFNHI